MLLKLCIVIIIQYHRPTICTLYYTLKCLNYTPTCFELINRFIFRESHNFTNHTLSNNMDPRSGCSCLKYTNLVVKTQIISSYRPVYSTYIFTVFTCSDKRI
jgi:hypothetical protein